MKNLMFIAATLMITSSAHARINCANVNLVGAWSGSGNTTISRDSTTKAYSGVDTNEVRVEGHNLINRSYYALNLDTESCVFSQKVLKTSLALESKPNDEEFSVVDETNPRRHYTFAVLSFFKILNYNISPYGRELTLETCTNRLCTRTGQPFTVSAKLD